MPDFLSSLVRYLVAIALVLTLVSIPFAIGSLFALYF